jgi:hypothetical protein
MMIMANCERILSFTMAAVSFNKRVIGDAARAVNAIPVQRPEDYKVKGKGKVRFTSHTEILVNDKFN